MWGFGKFKILFNVSGAQLDILLAPNVLRYVDGTDGTACKAFDKSITVPADQKTDF